MKKIFSMMIVAAAVAMVSCGGAQKPAAEAEVEATPAATECCEKCDSAACEKCEAAPAEEAAAPAKEAATTEAAPAEEAK